MMKDVKKNKKIFKKGIDKLEKLWYNRQVVKRTDEVADIAQSVEHVIGNDEVISSNLIISSKNPTQMSWVFCVIYDFLILIPK